MSANNLHNVTALVHALSACYIRDGMGCWPLATSRQKVLGSYPLSRGEQWASAAVRAPRPGHHEEDCLSAICRRSLNESPCCCRIHIR